MEVCPSVRCSFCDPAVNDRQYLYTLQFKFWLSQQIVRWMVASMVLVKYRLPSHSGSTNYESLLTPSMEANNGNRNQKLCVSLCPMEVEASRREDRLSSFVKKRAKKLYRVYTPGKRTQYVNVALIVIISTFSPEANHVKAILNY